MKEGVKFAIDFSEVGKNTDYHGRVVGQHKVSKFTELGYEIVTTPVYVRTGVGEFSYLMEIPKKKFNDGQETKQLRNDLLTYDATGGIGKNLDKFTKSREVAAVNKAVDEMPTGDFIAKRVKKFFSKKED